MEYFGVRERGHRLAIRTLLAFGVLGALGASGCGPRKSAGPVEESLTSGRITVVAAAEVADLMARERAAFVALYPQAEIRLVRGTSREAVQELFAARGDLAVTTRELTPEERGAAVRGKLELEGYRFARDAIVMVVHRSNPVENLGMDGVRAVYEGRATGWRQFGGADVAVEPVVQTGSSDVTEAFVEQVMKGEPIRAPAVTAASDSQVLLEVARRPGAIGYVSLAAAAEAGKVLRLASLTGLTYWKPDLEAIHDGDYPLTLNLSLYLRPAGRPLAKGFVTFVTSRDGQQIVQQRGLVPTAVPVRFVRRSPMLGTHQEKEKANP